MMKQLKPLIIALIFLPFLAQAQGTVSGTVVDAATEEALPGVSVLEQGTTNGTITDVDGSYSIEVADDATLVFSYVGYNTENINVSGREKIDVSLIVDISELDEIVIVGYTKTKKSDIAGAISVVETEQLAREPNPNVLTSLQGRVPGVNVQSDGTPGGNNTSIVIRGVTSINSGTGPLFVVDGVQTYNIASINPDEIESMQVLKDGASAAIYGTRGANGVIIITTKKAEKGKVNMSFKAMGGIKELRDKIEVLNSEEWAQVKYDSYQGNIPADLPPYLVDNGSGFTLQPYLDPEQLQSTANTDWVDVIYDPAFFQQYDFSVSSGSENSSVLFGVNYFEDKGIQQYTGYERLNLRLNSSFTPQKWITISENLLVSNYNEVKANTLEDAALQNPLIPVYDNEGNYGGPVAGLQDKRNPLGLLWANQDNRDRYWRILGGLDANIRFTEWLTFTSQFAVDFTTLNFRGRQREFVQAGSVINQNEATTITTNNNLFIRQQFTNFLQFDKTFGVHNVGVMVGVEQIAEDVEGFFGSRLGIPNNDINNIYLSAGQGTQFNGSNQRQYRLSSQFAQLRYGYDDRYLFNATVRRDGSSRFGPNNRFAVFPSVSFAWKLINENFMANQGIFSDLKFRASYAISGNDQIGEGRFRTQYGLQSQSSEYGNYNIMGDGTGAATGIVVIGQGNPDITWEETTQYNFGIDAGIMENRVYVSVDYYNKLTEDLLVAPSQPATSGPGAAPFINAGTISNKGVELALRYVSDYSKEFSYTFDITAARNVNNVEDLVLDDREFFNAVGIAREGSPIGAFYGYETDGLFDTNEEIANHVDQTAINGLAPRLGGIKYVDVNGDGVVNADDRTIIGNPYPDVILGINFAAEYKGFDFSAFFDSKL